LPSAALNSVSRQVGRALSLQSLIRSQLKRLLGIRGGLVLQRRQPVLAGRLQEIDAFGLYLHIPFCRQICPYCPYNKELYRPAVAESYVQAVKREVDIYSRMLDRKPVTSFYVGGGTPTTMLGNGLPEILEHIRRAFNLQCDIHMESHPNDLSKENLEAILAMGVRNLSTGIEAVQDHHLRTLRRPYAASEARAALERAVHAGFDCVNADIIFALPRQTYAEVQEAGQALVAMGVDQVAAYPLFKFTYTAWERLSANGWHFNHLQRRRMLGILEGVFYDAGFERTSVWAFTRSGVPKYCSVTVPLYIGLGASGGSYLRDVFYLNTFNVREYIQALEDGRLPIALSLELSESMQMAGWLYWRIYETRFRKSHFAQRFGKAFDSVYGAYMRPLSPLGLLKDCGDEVVLTDGGAYWLHALQDLFSIDYISKLWGTSTDDPWPDQVAL
jgi:coproporphyrinogen III oxidase-like Fe-S oxidoreductase